MKVRVEYYLKIDNSSPPSININTFWHRHSEGQNETIKIMQLSNKSRRFSVNFTSSFPELPGYLQIPCHCQTGQQTREERNCFLCWKKQSQQLSRAPLGTRVEIQICPIVLSVPLLRVFGTKSCFRQNPGTLRYQ